MNPYSGDDGKGEKEDDRPWPFWDFSFTYQYWGRTPVDENESSGEVEEKTPKLKRKISEEITKNVVPSEDDEEDPEAERIKVRKSFAYLKERAVDKKLYDDLCRAEEETMEMYRSVIPGDEVVTTVNAQLNPLQLPPVTTSTVLTTTTFSVPSVLPLTTDMPVLTLDSGGFGVTDTLSVTPKSLRFIFMDVGQGNGTLVLCPNGESILVDLGCASKSVTIDQKKVGIKSILEPRLREFILEHTGGKLTYLVLSHGDKDHINMLENVLKGITVENVICGGAPEHFKSGKKWRIGDALGKKAKFLHDKGLEYTFYTEDPGSPNQTIKVKDVDIYIVGANAHGDKNKIATELHLTRTFLEKNKEEEYPEELVESLGLGTDKNASCIVLLFCYKGQKVIISADATFNSEREMLENPASKWKGKLKSYALIGGHHGSSDSFSREFLREVDPSWLMFSADLVDSFAHPTMEVVSRVLTECKMLKDPERRAWGPHGLVVGSRAEADPEIAKKLEVLLGKSMPLFEAARKFKLTLKAPLSTKLDPITSTVKEWVVALITLLVHFPVEHLPSYWKEMWLDIEPHFEGILERADFTRVDKESSDSLLLAAIDVGSSNYLKKHQDLNIETAKELPPLLYWAVRFSNAEAELQRTMDIANDIAERDKEILRMAKVQKAKQAFWYWLMTEYNMFTTMETANMGVYWSLEIDGYGQPWTHRW